jgi:DNA-binding response OmpR family regulator
MRRILLVEDDNRVAAALVPALERHGYAVTRVGNGAAALAAGDFDLVLLDLGLPDIDGLEVCRRMRRATDMPIIAVTARAEETQRIRGLRCGADDYVVKPYSVGELLARIEAVLRRTRRRPQTEPARILGDVVVDLTQRTVTVAGSEVRLTLKEFEVLAMLARSPGAVVTRDDLLAEVWQTTFDGESRTLDVHVATLRSKLERPGLVETVRGVGYRLAVQTHSPGAEAVAAQPDAF